MKYPKVSSNLDGLYQLIEDYTVIGGIISTALGVDDTPDAVASELKNNSE